MRAPFLDRFRRRQPKTVTNFGRRLPLPEEWVREKPLVMHGESPGMPNVPDVSDAPFHRFASEMAREASKRNYRMGFRDGVDETLTRLAPFAERDPELARFVDRVRLRAACEHVWTYSPSRQMTVCATCGMAAIDDPDIQTGLGGR